jgi:DNA modification methylase
MNYQMLKVSELQPFPIRDLRSGVLEKLKERIKEGYNPARPLSVIKTDGGFLVADGNHRLSVVKELGVDEVPCLVYVDKDPYGLAVKCNQDEDTYAPMDLFDWLDVIKHLTVKGTIYHEIGEKIGWSREVVSRYSLILKNVPSILKLAKEHQTGRGIECVPTGQFDFTERWFRDSGLYELKEQYQLKLIQSFINDGCRWIKGKVQHESAKYKLWQQFEQIAQNELVNTNDLSTIIKLIQNSSFKNESQLRQKISDLNKKAQNKLICGDCLIELEKLDDASIDLIITDPPYGIDYVSNRSQFKEHVTKEGLANDGLDEALELLDKTCEILMRKTKENAHFYFCVGWQTEPQFRQIISKYFAVKNVLIWDKGNHGAGDLEGAWGNRYEMIIFASKGRRTLNKPRMDDIITVPKVNSTNMIHPTQKPTELIKILLTASSQKADTVCDPFMGSGSTIKAVNEFGGLNYIGIELTRDMFEKAKSFVGG